MLLPLVHGPNGISSLHKWWRVRWRVQSCVGEWVVYFPFKKSNSHWSLSYWIIKFWFNCHSVVMSVLDMHCAWSSPLRVIHELCLIDFFELLCILYYYLSGIWYSCFFQWFIRQRCLSLWGLLLLVVSSWSRMVIFKIGKEKLVNYFVIGVLNKNLFWYQVCFQIIFQTRRIRQQWKL